MSSSDSVTLRIGQLRSPDRETRERAAREIVQRYFQTLVCMVMRKLDRRIRPIIDGEDIVQSALGSFFRCEREDRFVLESRDNLEKVLIAIALNKTLKVARFHRASRRDVNRIEQSPAPSASGDAPYPDWLFDYMDRSAPAAEEVSMLADLIGSLPEELRAVAELKLMGYQDKEIAAKFDLTAEAIRLRKRRIEHEWRKHFPTADEGAETETQ